ncbi:MAG: serine hydrolase [Synechococcaceae cyanobacterium]
MGCRHIAAPAVAALLLSFTTPSPLHAAPAEEPRGGGSGEAVPREVVSQIETLTQQLMQRTGVPGVAIAVVRRDQPLLVRGFGVRRIGRPEPVDAHTLFPLASLSKPITSTVLAGVVGDGRAGWDDPVTAQLPEFRLGPPAIAASVTLRDLLSHRSGLGDHAGDPLEDLGFDRATILQRLSLQPLGNRFRASYAYTNFGFTAAAVAVARQQGSSWEELAAERLYRPLGMERTSSRHADFRDAPNRVRPHVRRGDRWVVGPDRNADAQSPAGGVSSSAHDLSRWLRLQLDGGRFEGRRLVAAAALGDTHRPLSVSRQASDPSSERSGFYGLGWGVNVTDQGAVQLSHSGAFAMGAATAVYLLPAEGLGVVVLTNAAPLGLPESLALGVLDLISTGTVQRDYLTLLQPLMVASMAQAYPEITTPARALPPRPLQAYVGRYRNAYVGEAVVSRAGAGLRLQLGPALTPYPLTHVSGDTFRYQPPGENGVGPSAVVFAAEPAAGDGAAISRVRLANLDTEGLGVLQRQ